MADTLLDYYNKLSEEKEPTEESLLSYYNKSLEKPIPEKAIQKEPTLQSLQEKVAEIKEKEPQIKPPVLPFLPLPVEDKLTPFEAYRREERQPTKPKILDIESAYEEGRPGFKGTFLGDLLSPEAYQEGLKNLAQEGHLPQSVYEGLVTQPPQKITFKSRTLPEPTFFERLAERGKRIIEPVLEIPEKPPEETIGMAGLEALGMLAMPLEETIRYSYKTATGEDKYPSQEEYLEKVMGVSTEGTVSDFIKSLIGTTIYYGADPTLPLGATKTARTLLKGVPIAREILTVEKEALPTLIKIEEALQPYKQEAIALIKKSPAKAKEILADIINKIPEDIIERIKALPFEETGMAKITSQEAKVRQYYEQLAKEQPEKFQDILSQVEKQDITKLLPEEQARAKIIKKVAEISVPIRPIAKAKINPELVNILEKNKTSQNKGSYESFIKEYKNRIKNGEFKTGEDLSKSIYNEKGSRYYVILANALGTDDFSRIGNQVVSAQEQSKKTFDRFLELYNQPKPTIAETLLGKKAEETLPETLEALRNERDQIENILHKKLADATYQAENRKEAIKQYRIINKDLIKRKKEIEDSLNAIRKKEIPVEPKPTVIKEVKPTLPEPLAKEIEPTIKPIEKEYNVILPKAEVQKIEKETKLIDNLQQKGELLTTPEKAKKELVEQTVRKEKVFNDAMKMTKAELAEALEMEKALRPIKKAGIKEFFLQKKEVIQHEKKAERIVSKFVEQKAKINEKEFNAFIDSFRNTNKADPDMLKIVEPLSNRDLVTSVARDPHTIAEHPVTKKIFYNQIQREIDRLAKEEELIIRGNKALLDAGATTTFGKPTKEYLMLEKTLDGDLPTLDAILSLPENNPLRKGYMELRAIHDEVAVMNKMPEKGLYRRDYLKHFTSGEYTLQDTEKLYFDARNVVPNEKFWSSMLERKGAPYRLDLREGLENTIRGGLGKYYGDLLIKDVQAVLPQTKKLPELNRLLTNWTKDLLGIGYGQYTRPTSKLIAKGINKIADPLIETYNKIMKANYRTPFDERLISDFLKFERSLVALSVLSSPVSALRQTASLLLNTIPVGKHHIITGLNDWLFNPTLRQFADKQWGPMGSGKVIKNAFASRILPTIPQQIGTAAGNYGTILFSGVNKFLNEVSFLAFYNQGLSKTKSYTKALEHTRYWTGRTQRNYAIGKHLAFKGEIKSSLLQFGYWGGGQVSFEAKLIDDLVRGKDKGNALMTLLLQSGMVTAGFFGAKSVGRDLWDLISMGIFPQEPIAIATGKEIYNTVTGKEADERVMRNFMPFQGLWNSAQDGMNSLIEGTRQEKRGIWELWGIKKPAGKTLEKMPKEQAILKFLIGGQQKEVADIWKRIRGYKAERQNRLDVQEEIQTLYAQGNKEQSGTIYDQWNAENPQDPIKLTKKDQETFKTKFNELESTDRAFLNLSISERAKELKNRFGTDKDKINQYIGKFEQLGLLSEETIENIRLQYRKIKYLK